MLPRTVWLHRALDVRVHDAWYWSVVRAFVMVIAWMILAYVYRYWPQTGNAQGRWRLVFFAGFALFVMAQELEQFGQPVLVGRVLTLLLLCLVAVAIMRTRGQ